jgi:hypothetical protein
MFVCKTRIEAILSLRRLVGQPYTYLVYFCPSDTYSKRWRHQKKRCTWKEWKEVDPKFPSYWPQKQLDSFSASRETVCHQIDMYKELCGLPETFKSRSEFRDGWNLVQVCCLPVPQSYESMLYSWHRSVHSRKWPIKKQPRFLAQNTKNGLRSLLQPEKTKASPVWVIVRSKDNCILAKGRKMPRICVLLSSQGLEESAQPWEGVQWVEFINDSAERCTGKEKGLQSLFSTLIFLHIPEPSKDHSYCP